MKMMNGKERTKETKNLKETFIKKTKRSMYIANTDKNCDLL